jgi:hypothetical protein
MYGIKDENLAKKVYVAQAFYELSQRYDDFKSLKKAVQEQLDDEYCKLINSTLLSPNKNIGLNDSVLKTWFELSKKLDFTNWVYLICNKISKLTQAVKLSSKQMEVLAAGAESPWWHGRWFIGVDVNAFDTVKVKFGVYIELP